jgi:Outer membrane lipoprotein carrier protein LolA-like
MTSGIPNRARIAWLLTAFTTTVALCADLDANSLIRKLAKPAPATIEFLEARFSPLLKEPIVVSGNLGCEGPTSLDRHVTTPYREDTEIRGESVQVQREGQPVRSFALKHAPELRALLGSFAALLNGDPASVAQSFSTSAHGDEAHWTLELTPLDARTKKRLQHIIVDGSESTPHCFALASSDGAVSIMLLGESTHLKLPQPLTREWLEQQCGGGRS